MLEVTLFPPETAEQWIDIESYITGSIYDAIGNTPFPEVSVRALGYTAIINGRYVADPTLTPFPKCGELRFSAIDNGRPYTADLFVTGTDIASILPACISSTTHHAKSIYSTISEDAFGNKHGDDTTCAIGAFNRFTGPRGTPITQRPVERVNSSHSVSTALRDGLTDYIFLCAKDLIKRLYTGTNYTRSTGKFVKNTTAGEVVRTGIPRIIHIDASKHMQGKLGSYSVHSTHSARDATSPVVRPYYIQRLDIQPNDIVVMVNSDFYYSKQDMEYMMSRCICLFVTLQPTAPSGVYGGSGTFTMHRGMCHANIMGGARYQHRIWDFNHSHLIVEANSCYDRLVTVETSRLPFPICQHTAIVATFPGRLVRKASCCFGRQISGARLEHYRTSIIGESGEVVADGIVYNGSHEAEHPLFSAPAHLPRKVIGITPRSPNIGSENLNNDAVFVTLDNIAVTIEAYRRKAFADRAKDPASMVADSFEPAHVSRRRTATYLSHTITCLPYIDVTIVSPNSRMVMVELGAPTARHYVGTSGMPTNLTGIYPSTRGLNPRYLPNYYPGLHALPLAIRDQPTATPQPPPLAESDPTPPERAPDTHAGSSAAPPGGVPSLIVTIEHGCVDPHCIGGCGEHAAFQTIATSLTQPHVVEPDSDGSDTSEEGSDAATVIATGPPLATNASALHIDTRRLLSDPVPDDEEDHSPTIRDTSDVCSNSIPGLGSSCVISTEYGEAFRHTVRLHPPLVTVPNTYPGTTTSELTVSAWERFKRKKIVQTDDPKTVAWYYRMAKAFGRRVAKSIGQPVCAYSVLEVDTLMDKPSQRAATADPLYCQAASVPGRTSALKTFMKAEQVAPNNPSRLIICRDATRDPMRHGEARWALPLAEAFKKFRWYAGGKKPEEVDQALLECARDMAHHLLESDYSKFDASQQSLIAKCFLICCKQIIDENGYQDFIDTYQSIGKNSGNKQGTNVVGKAINGLVSFKHWYEMTSGRNLTTFENTTKQVFSHYCALVRYANDKLGKTGEAGHAWAWSRLGVYMGDDGVTMDLPLEYSKEICAELGLVLDANIIEYDSDGPVAFLGRLYPRLLNGDPSNFYDVRRFLRKAGNFAERDKRSAEDALILYAKGMAITDPHTPIIKEYCQLVLRSYPPERIAAANLKEAAKSSNSLSNWLYHTIKWGGDGRPPPSVDAIESYLPGLADKGIEVEQLMRLQSLLRQAEDIDHLKVPEGVAVDLGNIAFTRATVIGTDDGPRVYYAGEEYY
jgi:hypothetical protein